MTILYKDVYMGRSPWELPDGNADYPIAPAIVRRPAKNQPRAYHHDDIIRIENNLNRLCPNWWTGDTSALLHSPN